MRSAHRTAAVFVLIAAGCQFGNAPRSPVLGVLPTSGSPSLRTVLNESYLPTLVDLLDSAQTSVRVVHFSLNRDSVGDFLEEKLRTTAARGVNVEVLLENSVDSNPARVLALEAAGVFAKLDGASRYTHAKLVVVDAKRALFGSTNWSQSSLERNNEANLLVDSSASVQFYDQYAQSLFRAPDVTPNIVAVSTELGTPMKEGDYVPRAKTLLDAATRRVDLVVYGMNADPRYPDSEVNALINKMSAAFVRGVRVRVILETSAPDLGVNTVNRQAADALKAAGVEVRLDPPSRITHAKVLLVDETAILGSNNWGYGGFTSYHEVGMTTSKPEVLQDLSTYFDAIWDVSSPY